MGLQPGKSHEVETAIGQRHDASHRRDRRHAEGHGHRDHRPQADLERWHHEDRNQRFAGPEHEDDEQAPGGQAGHPDGFARRVLVAAGGLVVMRVDEPAGVFVHVALPPAPPREGPGRVGQAEGHQGPRREIAPDRLDRLEDADAALHPVVTFLEVETAGEDRQPDAGAAQQYGRRDVPAAAQPGHPQRPAQGPAARFAEHDEGQCVVDADQRMDEADADRCRNQNPDCVHEVSRVPARSGYDSFILSRGGP